MATRVKVYRWHRATDAIPLNESDWTMYELPAAGDRYWHGSDGFTVRDVDESQDPPVLNLVYDHEWMREVHDQLPEGYGFEGGRSSDDGQWHFMATTPEHGRPLGPEFDDNLDAAMSLAIASAAKHYQVTSD